eukprot:gb/GECH01008041.1/.p1 GENE.gb/GECH01008041.1/~~gb/GECH01008041.1/.p1  ORF type:complete len:534 (+),score=91.49 gb/GECH01008041.1/:1-1602(+)
MSNVSQKSLRTTSSVHNDSNLSTASHVPRLKLNRSLNNSSIVPSCCSNHSNKTTLSVEEAKKKLKDSYKRLANSSNRINSARSSKVSSKSSKNTFPKSEQKHNSTSSSSRSEFKRNNSSPCIEKKDHKHFSSGSKHSINKKLNSTEENSDRHKKRSRPRSNRSKSSTNSSNQSHSTRKIEGGEPIEKHKFYKYIVKKFDISSENGAVVNTLVENADEDQDGLISFNDFNKAVDQYFRPNSKRETESTKFNRFRKRLYESNSSQGGIRYSVGEFTLDETKMSDVRQILKQHINEFHNIPFAVEGDAETMNALTWNETERKMNHLKNQFSKNNVPHSEFRQGLKKFDPKTTDREIRDLILQLDPKRTGKINVASFIDIFGNEFMKSKAMRHSVGINDKNMISWPISLNSNLEQNQRQHVLKKLREKRRKRINAFRKPKPTRSSMLRQEWSNNYHPGNTDNHSVLTSSRTENTNRTPINFQRIQSAKTRSEQHKSKNITNGNNLNPSFSSQESLRNKKKSSVKRPASAQVCSHKYS